jgi:xanthine dehydrogenase accessory factor
MSILGTAAELEKKGEAVALCTIINGQGSIPRHVGSKMLVYPDGHIDGSVGGGELEMRVIKEALASLSDAKSRIVHYNMVDPAKGDPGICGGQADIYIEPILKPLLVVIGGGHVGRAVSHLAKWLGFAVAVSDDRPEFCSPESMPDADAFYPVPMAELPNHLKITPQTYLVLTTRGMAVDVPGLPALLDTPAAYIGIIGSKRRWISARKELEKMGVSKEKLDRVQSPIGLELKAETPEEIAVSIIAEILMLRNGGTGERMKLVMSDKISNR